MRFTNRAKLKNHMKNKTIQVVCPSCPYVDALFERRFFRNHWQMLHKGKVPRTKVVELHIPICHPDYKDAASKELLVKWCRVIDYEDGKGDGKKAELASPEKPHASKAESSDVAEAEKCEEDQAGRSMNSEIHLTNTFLQHVFEEKRAEQSRKFFVDLTENSARRTQSGKCRTWSRVSQRSEQCADTGDAFIDLTDNNPTLPRSDEQMTWLNDSSSHEIDGAESALESQCWSCGTVFPDPAVLAEHLAANNQRILCPAPFCFSALIDTHMYYSHWNVNHKGSVPSTKRIKLYLPYCHKNYRNREYLSENFRLDLFENDPDLEDVPGHTSDVEMLPQQPKCSSCETVFPSAGLLEEHEAANNVRILCPKQHCLRTFRYDHTYYYHWHVKHTGSAPAAARIRLCPPYCHQEYQNQTVCAKLIQQAEFQETVIAADGTTSTDQLETVQNTSANAEKSKKRKVKMDNISSPQKRKQKTKADTPAVVASTDITRTGTKQVSRCAWVFYSFCYFCSYILCHVRLFL